MESNEMMDQDNIEPKLVDLCFSNRKLVEKSGGMDENSRDFDSRLCKKARIDSGHGMKRVAEILMVLSAMGKIRGGRNPSSVERGLMAEAREKLVAMCEGISPKDLVTRDAVRFVTEDLGFNRARDQRFGFRPPKMSIAEKVTHTKRKMEDSKEIAAQSTTFSSQALPAGVGANSESHGTFFHAGAAHRFTLDKQSPVPLATCGFQPTSSATSVYALSSPSLLNQSQVNEAQSSIIHMESSSGTLESVPSQTALLRTEAVHFRLDAQSNGPPYLPQVRASSSGNHLQEKTPTSASSQSPSVTAAKVGNAINMSDNSPVVPEGASEVNNFQFASHTTRDNNSRTFSVQSAPGNLHAIHQPLQAVNFVQAPLQYTNHNDIARNVQKVLQPRLPDHPNWTTPSIEYMNKLLTCQICKISINDVESLLVCDACEKGVHLKCLQSFNQKGIPKGEWHCPKCLTMSNGKPLPPKYGRVSRNVGASKVSSNSTGVQASVEKRMENSDQKANHQKTISYGNAGPPVPAKVPIIGHECIESKLDSKIPNARDGVHFFVSGMKVDVECYHDISSDNPKGNTGSVTPLNGTPAKSDPQHFQHSESAKNDMGRFTSASNLPPNVESGHSSADLTDIGVDPHSQPQLSSDAQGNDRTGLHINVSESQMHEISNVVCEGLKGPSILRQPPECKPVCDFKHEDQDDSKAVTNGSLDNGNGASECGRASVEHLHTVDWVGDILKVVDHKAYYESCCINGLVYRLQDYALFCSNNHKLTPSKLQVLWEDCETRSKWAIVNKCYFPGDLPEVADRSCTLENNEVYESSQESTIMAGLIQGQCEVLPPSKYREESEKQTRAGHETNEGLPPIFLCKGVYDETKWHLRHVTD